MSLNETLNEKMLKIRDNTKDAVIRGFEKLVKKGASIPAIHTLESMIETVERYPNIEPVINRYHDWIDCELFSIGDGEVLEEYAYPDITQGLLYDGSFTYLFTKDRTYMSDDGIHFGVDPTNWQLENPIPNSSFYTPYQTVTPAMDFTVSGISSPTIYIGQNKEDGYPVYLSAVINDKGEGMRQTFLLLESEFRIVGLFTYEIEKNKFTLIIVSESEIYLLDLHTVGIQISRWVETNILPSISPVAYPTQFGITAISEYKENVILVSGINPAQTANSILAALCINGTTITFHTITNFKNFTITQIVPSFNNKIYVFDDEKMMITTVPYPRIWDQTFTATNSLENDKYLIHKKNSRTNEYEPIDLLYGVCRYKNYMIFITPDSICITKDILITSNGLAIIRDSQIPIPHYAGIFTNVWIVGDFLYIQGVTGNISSLKLPKVIGSPEFASKSSIIADGVTGELVNGMIGQDIEGYNWRKILKIDTSESCKVVSVNRIAVILIGKDILYGYNGDYQSCIKLDDLSVFDPITNSYKKETLSGIQVRMVTAMNKIWLFDKTSDDQIIIYSCDSSILSWTKYDNSILPSLVIEHLLKPEENIEFIGAGEDGFILINKKENIAFPIGPQFELPDDPLKPLEFLANNAKILEYIDGKVWVLSNTTNYFFNLSWSIDISGKFTCSAVNLQSINCSETIPFIQTKENSAILSNGILILEDNKVYYTPFSGYGYVEGRVDSFIVLDLQEIDSIWISDISVIRLSNSILISGKKENGLMSYFITYNGYQFYPVLESSLPFREDNGSLIVNVCDMVSYIYENGSLYMCGTHRNESQDIYHLKKIMIFKEQFHYHFPFSPRYLFFAFRCYDRIVGGYVTIDNNIANHEKGYFVYNVYTQEMEIFKPEMENVIGEEVINLVGQDFDFYIKGQLQIEANVRYSTATYKQLEIYTYREVSDLTIPEILQLKHSIVVDIYAFA